MRHNGAALEKHALGQGSVDEDEQEQSALRPATVFLFLRFDFFAGTKIQPSANGVHSFSPRGMESSVFEQGGREGRDSFQSRVPAKKLVYGHRAHDRGSGVGRAQGVSRSVFWDESAVISRRHLSQRRELFQHTDATGQSFYCPLVLSQGICSACKL